MKIRTAMLFGASVALSSSAWAAITTPLAGDIEVGSSNISEDAYPNVAGMALKTGLGDCLRLGAWSEDNQSNGCEGIEEEAEEPVAEVKEEEPAPVTPQYTKKVDTRQLSDMALFDVDSDQLNAAGLDAIDDLMAQLEQFKKSDVKSITVVGHTDNTGSDDYNMDLSERRAATIASMLRNSFPAASVATKGMGESDPIATNDSAGGRQQNRRVEIDIEADLVTFE